MADKHIIDAMWDDSPIDVSTEVNFIWSIANKLRGTYQSDKYKDVIIRRFECALAPTKDKVVEMFETNPNYPAKAMYRLSGFQFYNTSRFDLAELVNDSDHLAANFKAYIQGFSANIQDIIRSLDFDKQIDKMDKNNRLLSVVKAFSELDLNPRTIKSIILSLIFLHISTSSIQALDLTWTGKFRHLTLCRKKEKNTSLRILWQNRL